MNTFDCKNRTLSVKKKVQKSSIKTVTPNCILYTRFDNRKSGFREQRNAQRDQLPCFPRLFLSHVGKIKRVMISNKTRPTGSPPLLPSLFHVFACPHNTITRLCVVMPTSCVCVCVCVKALRPSLCFVITNDDRVLNEN